MGPISSAQWWNSDTVAVLTGGNKGVGFSIVQKLAVEGITVVLTAREEGRGVQATNDLHLKNVVFHKLDIRRAESVTKFVDWIKRKYGGRDILANNASVNYFDNVYEHAVECIDINYCGTVNLTEKLLPMLKPSSAGARIIFTNENLRQQFVDASKFDQKFLDGYAMKFVDASQAGEIEEYKTTFAFPAYCFSKLLANAYTMSTAYTRVTWIQECTRSGENLWTTPLLQRWRPVGH